MDRVAEIHTRCCIYFNYLLDCFFLVFLAQVLFSLLFFENVLNSFKLHEKLNVLVVITS